MSRSSSSRSLVRVVAECGRSLAIAMLVGGVGPAATDASAASEATLAEIEACASRNLPGVAGVIGFSVDAIDRVGTITTSRAELRWRKAGSEPTRILLVVSEPARTAGTALLVIDRKSRDGEAREPEFFVRLPEMDRVKRIRSRRLRGPVLGTDFSYEDLERLREPLDETSLELVGSIEIEERPAWVLETIPGRKDGSEYTRVLTYVDQSSCLPIRIELFEAGVDGQDRLRKQLDAPFAEIRPVGTSEAPLPHEFVMKDLRRQTRTIVRVERFDATPDLAAAEFTRAALEASSSRSHERASTPPAAPRP